MRDGTGGDRVSPRSSPSHHLKTELNVVRPALLFLYLAALGLAASTAFAADRFDLPQGPGRELIYGQCQTCHDLQSLVDSAGIGHGAWDAVLDNMRDFGLRIDTDQRAKILAYLSTYLGPNPPKEAPAPTAPAEAATADGAKLFADTCAACHQPDGKGKPGEFPPLAMNRDIFLARDFPILVVLHGLDGPIKVNGKNYKNTMPPFDFLSDAEIAAVINYVRSSFGNDALKPADMAELAANDVAAAKSNAIADDQATHAYRQSLK